MLKISLMLICALALRLEAGVQTEGWFNRLKDKAKDKAQEVFEEKILPKLDDYCEDKLGIDITPDGSK